VQNRDYLEELSVDGRMILKGVLDRLDGVEWIYVALDGDNWLACNTSLVSEGSFSLVLGTRTRWMKAFRLLEICGKLRLCQEIP
jgi:hypothetical protein